MVLVACRCYNPYEQKDDPQSECILDFEHFIKCIPELGSQVHFVSPAHIHIPNLKKVVLICMDQMRPGIANQIDPGRIYCWDLSSQVS